MKCHKHLEENAVAACTRCWRPICHDCCSTVSGKMVCKERCEEDQIFTEQFNAIAQENAKVASRAAGTGMGLVLGTMLLLVCFFSLREAYSLNSYEMQVIAYIIGALGLSLDLIAVTTFFSKD
ncbi:MAG: hypothetical protein WCJ56_12290 [bacterium]